MSPAEKLILHTLKLQFMAVDIINQSSPYTASGQGLNNIAIAMDLPPRKDYQIDCESDAELRQRIIEALK
jgi:hypothetical protein